MGVVYEAQQQTPKRTVALKVLRGGHFVDDLSVKLFLREGQALARLVHPAIGAIYEAGSTDDGMHFFAMEFVRGKRLNVHVSDLLARTQRSRDGVHSCLDLFRRICDAVHYAHQRGVIHRDLKPSNILVNEEKALGPDYPKVALTLERMGNLFEDMQDLEGAKEAHRREMAIHEKTLGPDHLYVGHSLSALGRLHAATGDDEEARSCYGRAIAIHDQQEADDDEYLSQILEGLARVQRKLGSIEAAEATEARLTDIRSLSLVESP